MTNYCHNVKSPSRSEMMTMWTGTIFYLWTISLVCVCVADRDRKAKRLSCWARELYSMFYVNSVCFCLSEWQHVSKADYWISFLLGFMF